MILPCFVPLIPLITLIIYNQTIICVIAQFIAYLLWITFVIVLVLPIYVKLGLKI